MWNLDLIIYTYLYMCVYTYITWKQKMGLAEETGKGTKEWEKVWVDRNKLYTMSHARANATMESIFVCKLKILIKFNKRRPLDLKCWSYKMIVNVLFSCKVRTNTSFPFLFVKNIFKFFFFFSFWDYHCLCPFPCFLSNAWPLFSLIAFYNYIFLHI